MGIIDYIKSARDTYVIRQVQRAKLPTFGEAELVRLRVVFTGRVQKIGFRLEVSELAKRLGLTGFCENLDSGAVLAELQGERDKVEYLIDFMHSLKRIQITSADRELLPLVVGDIGFETK